MSTKRTEYMCKNDYFMYQALLASLRSKDPNTQVGACIVNKEDITVATGYNGFPRGCSDDSFPWCKEDGLESKYLYVVHAERNAILNKNSEKLEGCRLFVTLFPCNECTKSIIQSGIKEVYYYRLYGDKLTLSEQASLRMMKSSGLSVKKYEPLMKEVFLQFDKPKLSKKDENAHAHAHEHEHELDYTQSDSEEDDTDYFIIGFSLFALISLCKFT